MLTPMHSCTLPIPHFADDEGDRITISSDEELLEAMDQFDGSIFKLYIRSMCPV